MKDDHARVTRLLGAWAVDACSAEEAEVVAAHIATCPVCANEARRLALTAADLTGNPVGPSSLRTRVLGAARARRPHAPAYAESYAARVATLDALLAELDEPMWATRVIRDWSTQDVVAHLAATDGLTTGWLAPAPQTSSGTGDEILAHTEAVIAHERDRSPGETRAAWRAQADALCRRLPDDSASRAIVGGRRMRVTDLMTARAFETWIHTDDIAGAVGRRVREPLPRHLHPIADLGVRSLPAALSVIGADRADQVALIVLTGAAGGRWLLSLAPGRRVPPPEAAPDVRIETDVLEFCFLAGGRRRPDQLDTDIAGDHALAEALLTAAPAFSGP